MLVEGDIDSVRLYPFDRDGHHEDPTSRYAGRCIEMI